MAIPGTRYHAWVIQSKSPGHARRTSQQQVATAESGPGLHARESAQSGRGQRDEATDGSEELGHPAQLKMPSAVNSRVPLGLWASVWAAHKIWLAREDGYDHWCLVCQEGGHLLKCDNVGCTAVQHAACSTQTDICASPWVCEDCWMLIDLGRLQLEDIPAGTTSTKVHSCWEDSGGSDESQEEDLGPGAMQQTHRMHEGERSWHKRDRKISGTWSVGKWVENASAMQGVILSMHHGYVQVRFGDEVKNCRRRQLTLLPGRASRQRIRERRGDVGDGWALNQGGNGTSSDGADSDANPVSPVSPVSADTERAHDHLEGVVDGTDLC